MTDNQTPDVEALDALAALIEQSDFAEESAQIVIDAGWVSPERVGDLQARVRILEYAIALRGGSVEWKEEQ